MAARLLLLLVVMLVFAALYGCAREAAKDRQPMKRVKEPTTAESAPHTPEESDDQVRRAKKAGVVVRAGNSAVVARAGEAVVRVGGFKAAKGEGTNATAPSREVTLKIEGSPGTEFSGTCIIGGKEEKKLSGRVPKRFIYELDGQRLECEISKQSSNSGQMKVVFSAVPMLDIAPIAATAMRAAIRPYSMAVAPFSLRISFRNLAISGLLKAPLNREPTVPPPAQPFA